MHFDLNEPVLEHTKHVQNRLGFICFKGVKVSLKVICFHICYIYLKSLYFFVITEDFINILSQYGIIFASGSYILMDVYLYLYLTWHYTL